MNYYKFLLFFFDNSPKRPIFASEKERISGMNFLSGIFSDQKPSSSFLWHIPFYHQKTETINYFSQYLYFKLIFYGYEKILITHCSACINDAGR